MRFRFTKMHGLGNDFVMLDGISQKVNLTPNIVKRLADRNFGVGCDQVLLVEAPTSPDTDFRYRIFNQDGSEVENCGNGARCFAVFVRLRGLTQKDVIRVETAGGELTLHVHENDHVTVDMGVPILVPEQIPFTATEFAPTYSIDVEGVDFTVSAVSMGNPHAVTVVDNVDEYPVERFGPLIEKHETFPKRVNAGFLEIINANEAKLRVFERGVGETLACGTGACAAMVAARLRGLLDSEAHIQLPGGQLHLSWEGQGSPVMMTGPAVSVFQGQIKL